LKLLSVIVVGFVYFAQNFAQMGQCVCEL